MAPTPQDALAAIAATTERLRAVNAKLTEQLAEQRRDNAEFTERMSEERRRGDHGRTWQVLQQRIDMRQTTEQDIYAGIDKSPEAREVREILKQNLTKLRVEVETLREEDEDVIAATERAERARRELEALQHRGVFGD